MRTWQILIITACLGAASLVYAEHPTSQTFNFSGSVSEYHQVENNFTTSSDGLVYFSLDANVPPSATVKYLLNFQKKSETGSVCLSFGEWVTTLKHKYGPFALKAGEYTIKTTIDTNQPVNYTTSVEFWAQTLPNDIEPNNNHLDEAQDLGLLQSGESAKGHIGYYCRSGGYTDYDNFKFKPASGGNYYVRTTYDNLDDTCQLSFQLHELKRYNTYLYSSPVTPLLQEASGTVYGPYLLKANNEMESDLYYFWTVSLSGCSYSGGGAYEVKMQLTPFITTPPFSVNSVTVTPNKLFWGLEAQVKTAITNNTGSPISDIILKIIVDQVSNNQQIGLKTDTLDLSAYQQKTILVSLNDLLPVGSKIDDLKSGQYMVTVYASHSATGHESTQFNYFEKIKKFKEIVPILQQLIMNKE